MPVAGRDVGLHPDDRLEAFLFRLLVEGPGAEHAAVVRESQPRHLIFLGLSDQVPDSVSTVEE